MKLKLKRVFDEGWSGNQGRRVCRRRDYRNGSRYLIVIVPGEPAVGSGGGLAAVPLVPPAA